MPKNPYDPFLATCPSRKIIDLVGSKWSFLLMCSLRHGPIRTGELMRTVGGISQKMLTQTLRELERNGLVQRISYPEVPPRVEYSLTEVGSSLSQRLSELENWLQDNFDYMVMAQRRASRSAKTEALQR